MHVSWASRLASTACVSPAAASWSNCTSLTRRCVHSAAVSSWDLKEVDVLAGGAFHDCRRHVRCIHANLQSVRSSILWSVLCEVCGGGDWDEGDPGGKRIGSQHAFVVLLANLPASLPLKL